MIQVNCKHNFVELPRDVACKFLTDIVSGLETLGSEFNCLVYPKEIKSNEVLVHCTRCDLWWIEEAAALGDKAAATEVDTLNNLPPHYSTNELSRQAEKN